MRGGFTRRGRRLAVLDDDEENALEEEIRVEEEEGEEGEENGTVRRNGTVRDHPTHDQDGRIFIHLRNDGL